VAQNSINGERVPMFGRKAFIGIRYFGRICETAENRCNLCIEHETFQFDQIL
jgi:hypothetical protein